MTRCLALAGRIGLAAVVLQCAPAWGAATVFEIEKLMSTAPRQTEQGAMVVLSDGNASHSVRFDYVRTLAEVHKRIAAVSKAHANVAVAVNRMPNATAIPLAAKNLIVVNTGMLELIGTDADMMAALLGHEYAHLTMKHSLNRVRNLPDLVYGASAIAERVDRDTGDRKSAMNAGMAALGLMAASFNRQQEVEADRVGTELMSSARYDPEGMPRLMTKMLQLFGTRDASYLDNHPGFEERISRAGPTVLNQRFDTVAATLKGQKSWKMLSNIVNHWLKVSPDSARAWYYRGTVLGVTKQEGSLEAFEKAVSYDPNFEPGQLALCIALHAGGRELESLICSERLPRGEVLDQYQAGTFQHEVYVSGMHGTRYITAQDVAIVQAVMRARKNKPAP